MPMLLALGMLVASWRSEELTQAQAQLLSHAVLTTERLQALQTQAILILELLALQEWLPDEPEQCLAQVQRTLAILPRSFANLLVIDPTGQVLCNAKAPEKRHNLADRDYVQRALAEQATGVGGLIIGRTTGTPVIGLASPHKAADGRITYLLGTSIELGEIVADLKERLPPATQWWLLDGQNQVLASADPAAYPLGQAFTNHHLLRDIEEKGEHLTLRHTDAKGQLWLVSHMALGKNAIGDRLILARPATIVLEPVNTIMAQAGAILLAALLFTLLLAWWVAHRFSKRRITPLLTALQHIEYGDFTVRLPHRGGQDELDRLAQAIDHMAKTLQAQDERIRHQQAELVYQAQHDPLTGLPNRLMIANDFAKTSAKAKRLGERIAILMLDLDHFKTINEGRGHSMGDRLLVTLATRLRQVLREEDTLARIGGDEFLILLEGITRDEQVIETLKRIQQMFKEPFLVDGEPFELTASIGIALYPNDSIEFERLMQQADAALHQCKSEERNSYRFFAPQLTEAAEARLAMEQMLRDALRLGWFELHYQPQARLADGQRVGVEALLRLRHPSKGLIPPGQFIPVAEESHLIITIGAWVIKEACQQMARWRKAGQAPAYVAVNIAARQIVHDDLPATVRAALQESGIPSECLEIEVTEASFLKNTEEVLAKLKALHAIGVRLALDDFGTGYSSLAYLRRLPLDRLKIDQSFVRDMLHDKHDEAIVRAIIQLGQALELEVIAEGVETNDQAKHLLALGCPLGQGYLFGRPQPA
ncbi:MAG: EAL domain-containing protein [Gammaproteobacteria bacterium]|nr:EAL domain-containing protein [Gammaproteobacteria bacterium]